jgi:chromosomal replication initiation ATPase DnaA
MSLPSIGRALGGRDHTSIINSLRRYNDLEKDMEVAPMIAAARLALVAPVFRSVRAK